METTVKATSILSDEHKNISKVVGALVAERDNLKSGGALDKEFFEKAVDFIKNYADKSHHAKEEDILFVEVHKDGVEMHCDPIPQMLHEHDEGRNCVKNIVDGLNEGDNEKIIAGTTGYTDLIKEHIFKEDNILYPMADDALNDQAQESMLEKFKEAANKFADGELDRLIEIANDFENRGK